MLSEKRKRDWDDQGFFIIRNFAPIEECRAIHARVIEICRLNAAGESTPNVFVLPEKKPNPLARNPEDSVGKVFRLHRDPIFKKLVEDPEVVDIVGDLIGSGLASLASPFIFTNHRAPGQPRHPDSY